jgi:hypothetical protein
MSTKSPLNPSRERIFVCPELFTSLYRSKGEAVALEVEVNEREEAPTEALQ